MAVINLIDFNRIENSLTKACAQYRWGSKYYFPCCPKEIEELPLEAYFQNLKIGNVFAFNDDSPKLTILEFVKIKGNEAILVMCEREGLMSERAGFQPWLIAEITFENGFFIHSNLESHFEKDDADKEFCIQQGLEWLGSGTFDDFF